MEVFDLKEMDEMRRRDTMTDFRVNTTYIGDEESEKVHVGDTVTANYNITIDNGMDTTNPTIGPVPHPRTPIDDTYFR